MKQPQNEAQKIQPKSTKELRRQKISIRRKGYEVATNQELSNYEVSNQEAPNNEGQNEEVPNTELDASEDETMLMTSMRTTGSH